MVDSLRRPEFLSTEMPRVQLPPADSQPVVINDEPFSGIGYLPTGECAYDVVRMVDGVVQGPFDDPILPPGPYVNLEEQPGYWDRDDSRYDWFFDGEPFTGVSIDFTPAGHVDRAHVVHEAIPMDEFSFEESGAVRHRMFDQRFDPDTDKGLAATRQSLTWSPSGEIRSCMTSMTFEGRSASANLSLPDRPLSGRLDVSISDGYFAALQHYRDRLGPTLPVIDDVRFLGELTAPAEKLRLGLGDRAGEVIEQLAGAGYFDTATELDVSAYPDGKEAFDALTARPLPALRSFEASAGNYRGNARVAELDMLKVLLELKRRRRDLKVALDKLPLRLVEELSSEQDPGAVPYLDALYFDNSCRELVGVVGGFLSSRKDLLDYVVSASSLQFAKLPPAVPLFEDIISRLQERDDLIFVDSRARASDWVPEVLSQLR